MKPVENVPPACVCVAPPSGPLRGELRAPGDKSISQRLALLLPLAAGVSEVHGFLRSEDALHTLRAMETLGACARVEADGVGPIRIEGGTGRLCSPAGPLDLGNSGTGLRLLIGLLSGTRVEALLTGDASLCSRPMGRIRDPLAAMGAEIELRGASAGCAPVWVHGRPLCGIRYTLPVASAQVKSAVLLAGLFARGATTVIEPMPTRDHTERVFRALGLSVRVDGAEVAVDGSGPESPRFGGGEWHVPGDLSSAAFWLVAAAACQGACVTVRGVGLNPRRTAVLDVLRRMGAQIETVGAEDPVQDRWEPRGDLRVCGAVLRGTEIGGAEIPNLIDELPVLAVAAALADGVTHVRDAAELRVKESDRIAAVCENLRRAGIPVEERADGFSVRGGGTVAGGAVFESRGDHRIAMSFAVLSLFGRRPSHIEDVGCVATSYPGFWSDLERLGGRATERPPSAG